MSIPFLIMHRPIKAPSTFGEFECGNKGKKCSYENWDTWNKVNDERKGNGLKGERGHGGYFSFR